MVLQIPENSGRREQAAKQQAHGIFVAALGHIRCKKAFIVSEMQRFYFGT